MKLCVMMLDRYVEVPLTPEQIALLTGRNVGFEQGQPVREEIGDVWLEHERGADGAVAGAAGSACVLAASSSAIDNLRWLIEYNPAADETLRPAGDPKPLTRRLRECATEIERLRKEVDAMRARGTERQIFDLIRQWAADRNLIEGATRQAQMLKLFEEGGELAGAIARGKEGVVKDSIGDMVVVLTILAAQSGVTIEACIAAAYEEIKDRKGRMVNGVFIKEESKEPSDEDEAIRLS